MRPPLIAGNWKMNGLLQEARELASGLRRELPNSEGPEVVVCPPYIALPTVGEVLAGSPLRLGAQDLHWEGRGAYTGEVSPAMLKDVGCTHVIIGHSERRHIMGETHEMVNKKVRAALGAGLTPILCVGELLEERSMGVTREVVERQLSKGLEGVSSDETARVVFAYEPVWAIGTGKTATPSQAQEVHHYLRKLLSQRTSPEPAARVRILYGGSVKPDNIRDLMAQEDIDGVLVGNASLSVSSFAEIVRYTR